MAPEQNLVNDAADEAEVPKEENEDGKEEDDELAEYGLDKYDEEDTGELYDWCLSTTLCPHTSIYNF